MITLLLLMYGTQLFWTITKFSIKLFKTKNEVIESLIPGIWIKWVWVDFKKEWNKLK